MSNRMHIPRQDLIIEAIQDNLGETKVVDDWHRLINKALPQPKRMSKNGVAHVLASICRGGDFVLVKQKIQRNTYYTFEQRTLG